MECELTTVIKFQRGLSRKGSDQRWSQRRATGVRGLVPGPGGWPECRDTDSLHRCWAWTASLPPPPALSCPLQAWQFQSSPSCLAPVASPAHPQPLNLFWTFPHNDALQVAHEFFLCLDSSLLTKSTPWVGLSHHHPKAARRAGPRSHSVSTHW